MTASSQRTSSSGAVNDAEIRVFISSTFEDMKAEREHLVRQVFPEIRRVCAERGLTFTEIDLRWGITERQARRKKIVSICLDEIHRHKPYVIAIIGDRFGWQPTVDDLGADAQVLERYPWLRRAVEAGRSLVELETLESVVHDPTMRRRVRFYFRVPTSSGSNGHHSNSDESEKARALKDRIRSLRFPVREAYADVKTLGEWVRQDLLELIERRTTALSTLSGVEQERRGHEAFAVARRRVYVHDKRTLRQLNDYAAWREEDVLSTRRPGDGVPTSMYTRAPRALPLVITGASGAGKSSLLAWWSHHYGLDNPDAFIITHFVGATATSGSHLGLMRRVMLEIRERYGVTADVPSDPAKIAREFANWLGYAARERLVLVIDGLNELNDSSRKTLRWIPESLPRHVRLIVSTTEGDVLDALEHRGWQVLRVKPLTRKDRQEVVRGYLRSFGKDLDDRDIRRIISDEKSASPFYLVTTIEELRLVGRHDGIGQQIQAYLEAKDLEELFQRVLSRWEQDYGRRLVPAVMRLLWASLGGLSERELMALTGCRQRALSKLADAATTLLTRRDGMLALAHDSLRQAVRCRYLRSTRKPERDLDGKAAPRSERTRRVRSALAEFFAGETPSPRVILELLWQYRELGDGEHVAALMSRPDVVVMLNASGSDWTLLETWARLIDDGHDVEAALRSGMEAWRPGTAEERAAGLSRVAWILTDLGRYGLATELFAELVTLAVADGQLRWGMDGHRGLGLVDELRGEYDTAMKHIERSLHLAETLGDHRGMLQAVATMGTVHEEQGRYAEALECFERSLALSEETGNLHGMSIAIGNIGAIHFYRGQYTEALECYGRQLAMSEELGNRRGMCAAIGSMSLVFIRRGDYARAMESLHRQLSISEESGDRAAVAVVIGNIGHVHEKQGRHNEALECFRQELATCEQVGNRAGMSAAIGSMANIHRDQGRYAEALKCYEQYLEMSKEMGRRRGTAVAIGNMSMVFLRRGEYDRAFDGYQRALSLCEELGDLRGTAVAVGNLGIVHAKQGRHPEAFECFGRQRAICEEIGDRPGIAAAFGNLGDIYLQLGDYDRSVEYLLRKLTICEELGNGEGAAAANGTIGSVRLRQGRYAEALECFRRASDEHRAAGFLFGLADWLQGIANVLLDLALHASEEPPFLGELLTRQSDEVWTEAALRSARRHAEECQAISAMLPSPETLFTCTILLARIDAAVGSVAIAVQRLEDALAGTSVSVQRADVHYWLWRIAGRTEDRSEALRLLSEAINASPRLDLTRRIDELAARVPAHAFA